MSLVSALAHAFIPRESNNHKARVLQTPVLVVLLFLFLLSQRGVSTVSQEILGYASQISPTEVIRLTNVKRAEAGLSTLVENADLDRAAKAKGADMLAKGYWAHVAPDGTQPWDFFKTVGYQYRFAGENLARDFTNPASAVDAWMASPSHRENLLSSRYKEIGVAVVDGSLNGKDATIIVQLFGSTVADRPQVPVAAASDNKKTASPAAQVAQATAQPIPIVALGADEIPPVDQGGTQGVADTSNVAKWFSLGAIVFILAALIIDAAVLWIRGRQRASAKPFAQIAFLGMIIAFIIIAKAGQIL